MDRKSGMLQSMGLQKVRQGCATEQHHQQFLNCVSITCYLAFFFSFHRLQKKSQIKEEIGKDSIKGSDMKAEKQAPPLLLTCWINPKLH